MPVALVESRPVAEALTPAGGPGRFLVQLISPGWGSSGYYSQDVLEAAGRDRVWPAGTHMYLDHPTESETWERPERSVRDLVAVLDEDARWDAALGALVAEARVFSKWREPLAEMLDAIGVSIRGSAEGELGEAEGRAGRVFTRLLEGASVDFVTHAGRGGKVLQVLESARAATRIREATANDRREQLSALVKDTYGADGVWVWVRDFDDTTVWFDVEQSDETGTFAQTFTVTGDAATALTGTRTEVRAVTTYVPVNPAGQSTPTQESEEDTMPNIEEARLRQLEEDAGRVTTLESERDQAIKERDAARKEIAESHKAADRAKAEAVIAEADVDFDDLQKRGLLAELPTTEAGRLDVDAFTKTVTEHAAKVAEAAGAGRVRGMGGTTTPTGQGDVSEADIDTRVAAAFGRQVKEA